MITLSPITTNNNKSIDILTAKSNNFIIVGDPFEVLKDSIIKKLKEVEYSKVISELDSLKFIINEDDIQSTLVLFKTENGSYYDKENDNTLEINSGFIGLTPYVLIDENKAKEHCGSLKSWCYSSGTVNYLKQVEKNKSFFFSNTMEIFKIEKI